jgi:hypothetical protein
MEFMRMAIVWRNPCPVHSIRRSVKVSDNGSATRYFVEELIAAVQEEQWADLSILEALCGGHCLASVAETDFSC